MKHKSGVSMYALIEANVQRSLLLSFLTVTTCAFAVVFVSASARPGAAAVSASSTPLTLAIEAVYGGPGCAMAAVMSAFVVAALCWPFVTFMLYNARTVEKYTLKNILPRELLSLHQTQTSSFSSSSSPQAKDDAQPECTPKVHEMLQDDQEV